MSGSESAPVVVIATMYPLDGGRDAVLAGIRHSLGAIHAEQGCQLYAAHEAPDGTVVLIEKWASADDFAAHGSGAARDALRGRLDGLLAHPTVVTALEPVVLGEDGQSAL